MAQGITIFRSLEEAIKAGFQVYDRTREGLLVRAKTANGWALAFVIPAGA